MLQKTQLLLVKTQRRGVIHVYETMYELFKYCGHYQYNCKYSS